MAGAEQFNERVLTLIYRVEPGCLGPEGSRHIEAFCNYSNAQLAASANNSIQYFFTPRYDKSKAELEYRLIGKVMKPEQVDSYLARLGTSLDEFEFKLGELAVELIEAFWQQED